MYFCCGWESLPLSADEEIRTPVWEHTRMPKGAMNRRALTLPQEWLQHCTPAQLYRFQDLS